MTTSRTAAGRAVAVLVLCTGLAAGCAQPGQLGSTVPAATPQPVPVAAPSTPEPPQPQPQVLGEGRLDSRVTLRTLGAATYSVRTDVLAPGASSDWLQNPGSEIAAVRSGGVVLQQRGRDEGSCVEAPYAAGQAFSVPDGVPYRVRNDGPVPAELLVTRLFAPDYPDPKPVEAPCSPAEGGQSG